MKEEEEEEEEVIDRSIRHDRSKTKTIYSDATSNTF